MEEYQNDEYKKYIEQNLINSLYELTINFTTFEENREEFNEIKYKQFLYKNESIKNILKSAVFSTIATLLINEGMDFGLDATQETFLVLSGTLVGSSLFQKESLYNKGYTEEEYIKKENEVKDYEKTINEFITNLIEYVQYYNEEKTWESISKKLFELNKSYIKAKQKTNQKFTEEQSNKIIKRLFGIEKVNELIELILETTKERDTVLEKNVNSKVRKR